MCKVKKLEDEGKADVTKNATEDEEVLFMAKIDVKSAVDKTWLIDSGCSNHLTSFESLFSERNRSFKLESRLEMVFL